MKFFIYNIREPLLKPYVQYILFNYSCEKASVNKITSFANTNICLGILKENQLIDTPGGAKGLSKSSTITAYLSGLYTEPHRLVASGEHDEICIDFTPLGYYHFFPFPNKKYIMGEEILSEAFGKTAIADFERIFEKDDFNERGRMIELFLLSKIRSFTNQLLSESLERIHFFNGEIKVQALAKQARCNEKRLYRVFTDYLDISPQDYMRIVRFRKALADIKKQVKPLTEISCERGYYDQSHFIREIKKFTGFIPKQCASAITAVEETVWMSISS